MFHLFRNNDTTHTKNILKLHSYINTLKISSSIFLLEETLA